MGTEACPSTPAHYERDMSDDETSGEMRDGPTGQAPPKALHSADSLVLVNTGDGKGKSTAAFGTMLRAVAMGWKVAVVQFMKSGKWKVGEEKIGLQLGVDWWTIGDGFTWLSEDMERTEAVAREAWRFGRELIEKGEHRLVIFDEITYPMNWGWIDTQDVVRAIRERPAKMNIIATGRDAPEALIEVADTVSRMEKVKHPFDRSIRAMKGIDF